MYLMNTVEQETLMTELYYALGKNGQRNFS